MGTMKLGECLHCSSSKKEELGIQLEFVLVRQQVWGEWSGYKIWELLWRSIQLIMWPWHPEIPQGHRPVFSSSVKVSWY